MPSPSYSYEPSFSAKELQLWIALEFPLMKDAHWRVIEDHAKLERPSLGKTHPALAREMLAYRARVTNGAH